MRYVVGRSEPHIIGSDKDRNRGCRKKDKDHKEFLCELCEAEVARGRHFVHELTSEVNFRTKCMTKIMAIPGKNDSGGSVHVGRRTRIRQSERTDGHQRETSLHEDVHRHASTRSCRREQHSRGRGTDRNLGTPSFPSNGGAAEREPAGAGDPEVCDEDHCRAGKENGSGRSISSAGALDMTNCDFSERRARNEMRHIIGSSEPDVIIGSDKDQNRGVETRHEMT